MKKKKSQKVAEIKTHVQSILPKASLDLSDAHCLYMLS